MTQQPDRLLQQFREIAGAEPEGAWRAPGRVNLIGEHTDYNDGFVLPIAINRQTMVAGALRQDDLLRVWSLKQDSGPQSLSLSGLKPGATDGWAGYAAGPAWALGQKGHDLRGADLVIDSDVPVGSGLSSSAALIVSVALALSDLHQLDLSDHELAAAAHSAEHDFVGVPCGVMDQMASALARAGHALFIDTRSHDIKHVPFHTEPEAALLVIDTGAPHRIASSAYGERRRACEEAARALEVKALRDVSPADLDRVSGILAPDLLPLVRHVVTENARVQSAVEALTERDWPAMGALMNASHESLRIDFRVSGPELDLAVDVSRRRGAFGARLTGGGFAGCAIALMPSGRQADLEAAAVEAFAAAGMRKPSVFEAKAAGGCSRLWPQIELAATR